MNEMLPQGQSIRNAVKWISDRRKEDESTEIKKLISEAIMRFDLTPKDSEFLYNMYRNN